jgi:hypothetical protein
VRSIVVKAGLRATTAVKLANAVVVGQVLLAKPIIVLAA